MTRAKKDKYYVARAMPGPKFVGSFEDKNNVKLIVQRIKALEAINRTTREFDDMSWMMDILACHCNGTPLRLHELLNSNDANFVHDVYGIRSNINRQTGQIENLFLPRCAR